MNSKIDLRDSASIVLPDSPEEGDANPNVDDPERGLRRDSANISLRSLTAHETEPLTSSSSQASSSGNYLKHKTSQIFDAVGISGLIIKKGPEEVIVAPALNILVTTYAQSDIAAEIKADGEALQREVIRSDNGQVPAPAAGASGALPDVVLETSMLRGRKRASYGTQFRILSGRAFKNLYRDPALLTAHYTSAIVLASTSLASGGGQKCDSDLFILF